MILFTSLTRLENFRRIMRLSYSMNFAGLNIKSAYSKTLSCSHAVNIARSKPKYMYPNYFSCPFKTTSLNKCTVGTNINQKTSQVPISNILKDTQNLEETAPFHIRLALVGSSVGMCTPFFATASIIQMWYYFLPRSLLGKFVKYTFSTGFWGISFITLTYVVPFLRNHSEIILPFAISNALTSGVWYTLAELIFGAEAILSGFIISETFRSMIPFALPFARIPLIGPFIGALTALTSPILWPYCFRLCWSRDMQNIVLNSDFTWISDFYNYIAVPVALPIGLVSGLSFHLLLKPLIFSESGSRGGRTSKWQYKSFTALTVILSLSTIYYCFGRTSVDDYLWEVRMNIEDGNFVSYNPKTKRTSSAVNISKDSKYSRDAIHFLHEFKNFFRLLDISRIFSTPSLDEKLMKQQQLSTSPRHKPRYILKDPITIDLLDDHETLYGIVDVLVRFKYLKRQLESKSCTDKVSLNEDISRLEKFAKSKYGFESIEEVYNKAVLLMISNQACKQLCTNTYTGNDSSNTKHSTKENKILEEIKKLKRELEVELVSYTRSNGDNDKLENIAGITGKTSISFLAMNIDALEEELKSKISYEVSKEEKMKIFGVYATNRDYDGVWKAVSNIWISTCVFSVVFLLVDYLTLSTR